MQPLRDAFDAAIAGAKSLLAQAASGFGRQRLLRSPEKAREYPYPVCQQGAVGRVMGMLVSTTIESTRSFLPRLTFSERQLDYAVVK